MENNNEVAVTPQAVAANPISPVVEKFNTSLRMAKAYAASTIIPAQYQNNISNCFIALQMAERMHADPFQVMQSLNVIKGRPSWSSAFIIAAVNQSGRFKTPINYKMTGSWKDKTLSCVAYATANDGSVCESIAVTYEMAKAEGWIDKQGSKWLTMPELMIRYRAAAFFGRQYCPDLLLGLMTTEEQRDIIDADFEVVEPKTDYAEATPQAVAAKQSTQNASVEPPVAAPQQAPVQYDTNDDAGF